MNSDLWWLHCCFDKAPQKLILSLWQQLHPFSRYSFQSGDLSSSSEFREGRKGDKTSKYNHPPPGMHVHSTEEREMGRLHGGRKTIQGESGAVIQISWVSSH